MNVFNLNLMYAYPYEERGKNVFYQTREFKTRIIVLPPGGEMPSCDMDDHVLFYVVEGEAEVTVDGAVETLKIGQCLVTPPATLSMKTASGIRMLGVQIKASKKT